MANTSAIGGCQNFDLDGKAHVCADVPRAARGRPWQAPRCDSEGFQYVTRPGAHKLCQLGDIPIKSPKKSQREVHRANRFAALSDAPPVVSSPVKAAPVAPATGDEGDWIEPGVASKHLGSGSGAHTHVAHTYAHSDIAYHTYMSCIAANNKSALPTTTYTTVTSCAPTYNNSTYCPSKLPSSSGLPSTVSVGFDKDFPELQAKVIRDEASKTGTGMGKGARQTEGFRGVDSGVSEFVGIGSVGVGGKGSGQGSGVGMFTHKESGGSTCDNSSGAFGVNDCMSASVGSDHGVGSIFDVARFLDSRSVADIRQSNTTTTTPQHNDQRPQRSPTTNDQRPTTRTITNATTSTTNNDHDQQRSPTTTNDHDHHDNHDRHNKQRFRASKGRSFQLRGCSA